jgi:succinate dehydrogenase flavin-adding protein (antitoxin of CptAB toxin-antitoxin module)
MTLRTVRVILASFLLIAGAGLWSLRSHAQPGTSPPATADSIRQAVQADKRGVVEKYMHLTPQEAKRFWPIYDDYQRRLDQIVKRQNRAILDYINAEDSMTDANAKRIVREVLEADGDEQKLRERTVRTLMAALPARKAARFMQIENKIRALNRYDLAERIPLVR